MKAVGGLPDGGLLSRLQTKPLLVLEVDVSGLGSRCLRDSHGRASTCLFCEELHLKRKTLVMFTHLNESEI